MRRKGEGIFAFTYRDFLTLGCGPAPKGLQGDVISVDKRALAPTLVFPTGPPPSLQRSLPTYTAFSVHSWRFEDFQRMRW